ncbi:MAG TPA: penicillin-binding protein 2 [Candidatus Saccharimonadales bacterium]|nr:penicillin-binding protein 2 [Candidatus Saccharimonadales bacterium]
MAYIRTPSGASGQSASTESFQAVKHVRLWHVCLVLVLAIFFVRLFYLQVIRHDYYKAAALSDQLKQYEIPATRGTIMAHDGERLIPIVLNEKLYTIYADPSFVHDTKKAASLVASVVGGDTAKYQDLMRDKQSRYAVLAKKVTQEQKNKILQPELPGIGAQRQDYRTYPQGRLAAQVLGFVNAEGKGVYGIEQALNNELKGTAGELKAITDVRGVPLASNPDNVLKPAVPGRDIALTLDLAMQKQVENLLKKGVERTKAESGSALIMDVSTGSVKAMANYPTYDPAKFGEVEDGALFNNNAVTKPIEVGSIMKPLTTAAALDQGVIRPNQTYADPAKWKIDEFNITNVEEGRTPGTRSITDILNMSLNTGVTWELMQMGGGTINSKARSAWYDYMTKRFRFGSPTGIEQGFEAEGSVPTPEDNGAGINLTYANTTFGQAMTATPVQMAAAMSAVMNGGTYYQPRLVEGTVDEQGDLQAAKPVVVSRGVVSSQVAGQLIPMMQYTIDHHNPVPKFDQERYMVGGKTGTAQIAKPGGGYYEDLFNGTYLGFVGGDKPQYVIAVFMHKPRIAGYAGFAAAQPVFVDMAHMLINNSFVTPKN